MIRSTKRTLVLTVLMGTTLSGCAMIAGAGDTVWSGTKSVARFVSTPVRYMLRDAPQEETQFAANSVPVTPLAEQTVEGPDTAPAAPFEAAVTSVAEAPVMGRTVSGLSITSIPAGTVSAPRSAGVKPVEIIETVQLSPDHTVDVLSVGNVTYVRTEGRGSLDDWRMCDTEAGGFWQFDGLSTVGTSNPSFERCMESRNYVLENKLANLSNTSLLDTQSDLLAVSETPLP